MRTGGKAHCDAKGCEATYQVEREDPAVALTREGWTFDRITGQTWCDEHSVAGSR